MAYLRCPYCRSRRCQRLRGETDPESGQCDKCSKSFFFAPTKSGLRYKYFSDRELTQRINSDDQPESVATTRVPTGMTMYGIKNEVTREYRHIIAKDREDAITQLGWTGQVKWVTPIIVGSSEVKEPNREEILPAPEKPRENAKAMNGQKRVTLEDAISLILDKYPDLAQNKAEVVAEIVMMLKARDTEGGKPERDEVALNKLASYYHYRFGIRKRKHDAKLTT